MITSILINDKSINHQTRILDLINVAEEIWMSVAFVKKTGTDLIIPSMKKVMKKNVVFNVIAGQNFGLTEPESLWQFFELFEGTNSQLYLSNFESSSVFHTKLYMFRKGKTGTIIMGSANITKGGLLNNHECSLIHTCKTSDTIWKDSLHYFQRLASDHARLAKKLYLKKYEKFYQDQKKARTNSSANPLNDKLENDFNYDKLREYLKVYGKGKIQDELDEKNQNYKDALLVLEIIATSKPMNEKRFKALLDELVGGSAKHQRYWNSAGLSRGKNGKYGNPGIYKHWSEFVKLVKIVRANKNKSPKIVFDKAKPIINNIPYAGVNYLTEIMMTYNPACFGNLNNSPVKVLRIEAGCKINSDPFSYNGSEYEGFNEVLEEMEVELGFSNRIEIDWFLNKVYWELKQKGIIK